MDLSKFSDEDLAALQKGDLTKVSDDGLQLLQQAQAPAKSPEQSVLEKAMSGAPATPEEFKAFGTGALQGATFGFSDELGAAKDVAGDVLTGKAGLSDLASKFREYQKSREASNKALQEASPTAYGVGELTGGLAQAALAPEIGGTKLAAVAGKLVPEALGGEALLAGKTGSTLANIAGKGAAGIIEGAPAGALYGAGMSEADLSKPKELASDVLSGAGMGSLTGLGLKTAGQVGSEALSKAGQIAKESDYARTVQQAFGLGQKGVDLTSTSGRDVAALMAKNVPTKIVNQIMQVDDMLGQRVGKAIDAADKAGVKINIDPALAESTKTLFGQFVDNPALMDIIDPKSAKVIKQIYTSNMGDLTPTEARALKDTFYDLTNKLSGLTGDASNLARQQGMKLAQSLDQQLKAQIPDYKFAAQKFYDFRSSIPETILQPGIPEDMRSKYLGDLKNQEGSLLAATKKMFSEAQMPGSAVTGGARTGLAELQQNLRSLQRTAPETIQALGGETPEDVFQGWRQKADLLSTLRQSQGVSPREGLGIKQALVGGAQGMGINMANKVGRATEAVGQSAPVKLATDLFSAADDKLMNLASSMKGNSSTQFLGDALEKALQNKDDVARNAVLFRMMQDPQYRGLLKSEGIGEQYEQK